MNIYPRNLELDLLRTFVAVVDGGGFTRAAERLHRTQSTVSQQVKRLESRLSMPLLDRNTRNFTLTGQGELLLGYARRMLLLNDEAWSLLNETHTQGTVRLGSAQELADGGLADILAHFSRLYPGITLEVLVDANSKLQTLVERGELDLAVIFQEPGQLPAAGIGCEVIDRLKRVWVANPEAVFPEDQPLPLVLANAPCIFRNSVLKALDEIGRPWRIALSTPSLSGMRAAVRAGLGVGVRTERWLESDLQIQKAPLPSLPDVELVMLTSADAGEWVVERLHRALLAALMP
ncbi:MAG: LysR substrate-binding domain-containing protein [Candidatus Thiodiazotropha sp.]